MFLRLLQGIPTTGREQLPFNLSCILGRGESVLHADRGWIWGATICCCEKIPNLGSLDAGWWHVTFLKHWVVPGPSCLLPFSVWPIWSHFPKRPPQLKHHLLLFIYLFQMFICWSLGQWLFRNCPTHELCVYNKTWWGCERRRVRITSLTLSKMFFWEGCRQEGAQWHSRIQEPEGLGMESPGWGEWIGNGGVFLKIFQCPVLQRMLGRVAGLEFSSGRAEHSHGWHLPSIPTCHSCSCWVLPPCQVEMTFGSINQETN